MSVRGGRAPKGSSTSSNPGVGKGNFALMDADSGPGTSSRSDLAVEGRLGGGAMSSVEISEDRWEDTTFDASRESRGLMISKDVPL
jgi:hypothetical protein